MEGVCERERESGRWVRDSERCAIKDESYGNTQVSSLWGGTNAPRTLRHKDMVRENAPTVGRDDVRKISTLQKVWQIERTRQATEKETPEPGARTNFDVVDTVEFGDVGMG